MIALAPSEQGNRCHCQSARLAWSAHIVRQEAMVQKEMPCSMAIGYILVEIDFEGDMANPLFVEHG